MLTEGERLLRLSAWYWQGQTEMASMAEVQGSYIGDASSNGAGRDDCRLIRGHCVGGLLADCLAHSNVCV